MNMKVITNEIDAWLTDRKAITLNSYIHVPQPGPGYWKLNITLLEDDEYCKETEKLINITMIDPTLPAVNISFEMGCSKAQNKRNRCVSEC